MADTNFKGAFWGSEVRKRQARSYWPTEADNTDGVDMSFANTVLLLNGEGTNGAQNQTFLDSSTGNVAITRNGNATQGSLSPFSPTGWSAYFDGTTDGISTASTPAVAFGATANNYTVEFWVYPIVHDGDYDIYLTTGNMNIGYYPGVGYGMTVSINDGSAYPGTYKITGGTAPTLHKWNHIAACRSGGTLRLFVNGVQTGNTHNDTFTHANNTIRVSYSEASYSPQCYISNVRIVKGHALYTGNFTPPRLLPLTPYGSNIQYPATANVSSSFTAGNVSFLSLRGPLFVDDSPSRLPITIANDSKIVPFSPYRNYLDIPRSYSSYFDGNGDYVSIPHSAAINLAGSNFTIEGWFYCTAITGSNQYIINKDGRNSPSNYGSYSILINNAGVMRIGIGDPTLTNTGSFYNGSAITLNTWTHFALVVTAGATLNFYQNGVVTRTVTPPYTMVDGGRPLLIGFEEGQAASTTFNGYITGIRITKGVTVYTGNFTPPSAPLLTSGNSTIYASVANVNTTFASANTSLLTLQDANIFDRSSNAFAITAFGNVQPTIQNPFGETITSNVVYDVTLYDGSGYFDNSGDYLTTASSSAFSVGTGDFTIEFWAYPVAGTNRGVFQLSDTAGGLKASAANSIALNIYLNNSITVYLNNTTYTTANNRFPFNTWTHLAIVRKSGVTKLYVNGTLEPTVGTSGSITDTTNYTGTYVAIGGYYSVSYLWDGYISNFRIIKGTAIYDSNFVPPMLPSSPVANTSLLLKFQNAGVVDRTGKGVIETLGNGQISTSVYKYGSGSIYLDGTGDGLYLPPSPNYGFGSGDFTIEFWIYFNSTASGQNIINGYTSGTTLNYTIYTGTNTLVYYLSSDGANWNIASAVSIGSIVTGTWYHVALVRSGSTIKPYLNGVAGTATTSSAAIFNSVPPLLIGYYPGSNYVNGYLDDIRITKGQARYDVSQSTITIPRRTFNLL